MATRIAWLANLDADQELSDPKRFRDIALPKQRLDELRARMLDLIAPGDIVIGDEHEAHHTTDTRDTSLTALAFCPTLSARQRLQRAGYAAPDAPSLDVLQRVNHRRFCAQLGQTLPNASYVDDMESLDRHLATPSPTGSYVIKRAFSFAGREQRRVRDGVLDEPTRGFCRRSFDRGEGAQVEPWFERVADYGKHGYLMRDGELLVGATRQQHVDSLGRFESMSATADITATDDAMLHQELERTAQALHDAGYFGPFGIDAFRYRVADGGIALNPRCEINARFSMGFPRELLLRALKSANK